MQPLSYARANDVDSAITLVAGDAGSDYLAGGTTKVDLLRLGVEHTERLVDINDLPLTAVEKLADGTIRIGALARMSDVARTPIIRDGFPRSRRHFCSARPSSFGTWRRSAGICASAFAARTSATASHRATSESRGPAARRSEA
jgi:hypothetical protein